MLPDAEREEALADLSPDMVLHDWSLWGRPEQHAPPGDWSVWLILSGRGWGKSRTGSEWIHDKVREHPGCRIGLLGRTASDARDVMVLGDSGLLNTGRPHERPTYKPSSRSVVWPNGSLATLYSADAPDQLRGPQFDYGWADELAAFTQFTGVDGLTAWDNLRIATRLGSHPQVIATTTPKRVPLIRALITESEEKPGTVAVTAGRTSDNASNLAASYLDVIYGLYEGTSLAAQELDGILMDEVEGALWSDALLTTHRVNGLPQGLALPQRFVGVDPSVAENPKDECGIVVAYSTNERKLHQRHAYVMGDYSVHGSPSVWVKAAVAAARLHGAPIVAESNQGGELVRMAVAAEDPSIPVYLVHSYKGKALRAEPIVNTYEQGRVHHVGVLAMLESQMTSWVPGESKKSPDRVDALVFALTAMLSTPPKGYYGPGGGLIRARAPRQRLGGSSSMNRTGIPKSPMARRRAGT